MGYLTRQVPSLSNHCREKASVSIVFFLGRLTICGISNTPAPAPHKEEQSRAQSPSPLHPETLEKAMNYIESV